MSDPEAARADQIRQALADLDKLVKDYGGVVGVGQEIKREANRLRHKPEFQAILHEPAAAALWSNGQKLEQVGQPGSAMLAYDKAEKLAPAPSAVAAHNRLAVMRRNPELVVAAETERVVQECNAKVRKAVLLAANNPELARSMLSDVVDRASTDSAVSAAAKEQLAKLP